MIQIPTALWAHVLFDMVAWDAGLVLGWVLYRWRLREATERLALSVGSGYFPALGAGAVAGAWIAGSLNSLRETVPTVSHSVVGALVGAIVGVELYKRARGLRGSTGGVYAAPFALGVVIGRWGCLFTGLPDRTYGAPTGLPWAINLGDGVGRHPVQAYESLAMLMFLAIYVGGLAGRRDWAMRRGFYALCIAYGAQRFIWEWLKPYPPVLGPFNLFHIMSAGLVVYGLVYWRNDLGRSARPEDRALSVSRPDHEPL